MWFYLPFASAFRNNSTSPEKSLNLTASTNQLLWSAWRVEPCSTPGTKPLRDLTSPKMVQRIKLSNFDLAKLRCVSTFVPFFLTEMVCHLSLFLALGRKITPPQGCGIVVVGAVGATQRTSLPGATTTTVGVDAAVR